VVIVMLENHSFDNVLGMLGRGDGFRLGRDGRPTAVNPGPDGTLVRAFPMPTPCQLPGQPSNAWNVGHRAFDHGRMDGFVTSGSGPVAMGYFTEEDLPFTYALARTFPISDRYFSSVMAQTFPNRRFLLAGTALGLIDDRFPRALPPRGTIFDLLNAHGITWRDYYSSLPTAGVFISLLGRPDIGPRLVHIDQFFEDAATGRLPQVAIVDPDFAKSSEENPQDVRFGDQFLAKVVHALVSGPGWRSTVMFWTYDEAGGYYDHVPPPPAVPPDNIPPMLRPGDVPGGFDRYGFRVPFGVVSPFARRNYVSHVVADHTSILRFVETKWNLPVLTRRDGAASDLGDCFDFGAQPPPFADPPPLPPVPEPSGRCLVTGPGTIPPPGAIVHRRLVAR
jgi:phospholipase C